MSRKTISRKAKAQSPADTERLVVPHVGPWRCCRCRANDGLQLVTDVRWVCWLHSRLLNTYHCRSAAEPTSLLSSSQYPSLQVSIRMNVLTLSSSEYPSLQVSSSINQLTVVFSIPITAGQQQNQPAHSRLLNTYHCRSAAAWTCSLWSSQYPSLQVSSSINLLFLTSHRPRLRSGSCHYHILLTVPQLPSHILQLR